MRERLVAFQETLARTRRAAFGRVATLLGATEVTPGLWDELEAALIQADVGVATTSDLLQRLRARAAREGILRAADLQSALRDELRRMLAAPENGSRQLDTARPAVALIVGTNGSGKTTSIAKLASRHKRDGRKVLLVAADTFRAAAGEQLDVWADRAGVEMIGGRPGADPGAIAFDALQAAQARGFDVVLVDTAGRLHTKYNLMQELKKVRNVIGKTLPGAPHATYLVLDGTTGQNALTQARQFKAAVDVTGVIVTKLDGTARGGMVFSITHELALPVAYIGTGEKIDDIEPFDAQAFVDSLFE
ncbi:MAG TPA: signal recognition particle-docking protein FtsY [Anaerolineae bacterium]|nr:signal recognition particle-docking protein FtsY [Anaerolineae bacterium]